MPTKKSSKQEKKPQMYIVRCNKAGVFFAEVVKYDEKLAELKNARKIWYWNGACGVEQLAIDGTANPEACKLTVAVPSMVVAAPIQIIPCTARAAESLAAVKEWRK